MLPTVIKNFGQTLGLKELAFNQDNVVHLHIESIGDLYLEDSNPFLLIYLIREVQHPDQNTYTKALDLCHFKQRNPFPMSPGYFKDNQLVFLIRFQREQLTMPNLNKALEQLSKSHDQIANMIK